jgi:hypothetical protein
MLTIVVTEAITTSNPPEIYSIPSLACVAIKYANYDTYIAK